MGTPDFAVPCLQKLYEQTDVLAVITQPDRPKGRGQKLMASPVKECALNMGLQVLQPEKIKTPEFTEILRNFKPDLIVVVAFGQILSKEILSIPPLGCVNVHASLLPYYRGAAPIHWSIIHGETKTGVTTMYMDEGLDTGDMILYKEQMISQEMTTGELHDCLMHLGSDLLVETITQLKQGKITRVPQNHSLSSYAPLLKKTTEKIDWTKSAVEIHNLVRGLNPWPGAYSILDGKMVKIWKTKLEHSSKTNDLPGQIIEITPHGFLVSTGNGILEILELQPASKRKMLAKDYVCGNSIKLNDCFE